MTLERFHFTGVDGTDYSLPKQIPTGALRKARHAADPMDQFFTVLETVADEETLAAIDALPVHDVVPIMRDWLQGATAPQSSSSSN